jgi:branched-chain amino acid transport system substrate-binding protein
VGVSIRRSLLTIRPFARLVLAVLIAVAALAPARAAAPIAVGFSMALTGAVAPNGKQLLLALEIWRDDVNAKGGRSNSSIRTIGATPRTCPTSLRSRSERRLPRRSP